MKWFLICYCAVSLIGCQPHSSPPVRLTQPVPEPVVNKVEQSAIYGASFDAEYNTTPTATCKKYKQLYQEGNWRAGWVLALHISESKDKPCLNYKEAILILTTLETEKEINSELIWMSRYHLRLLKKLQKTRKKQSKLKRAARVHTQQIADLKKLNQEQLEKLEALKAIATSINKE